MFSRAISTSGNVLGQEKQGKTDAITYH